MSFFEQRCIEGLRVLVRIFIISRAVVSTEGVGSVSPRKHWVVSEDILGCHNRGLERKGGS